MGTPMAPACTLPTRGACPKWARKPASGAVRARDACHGLACTSGSRCLPRGPVRLPADRAPPACPALPCADQRDSATACPTRREQVACIESAAGQAATCQALGAQVAPASSTPSVAGPHPLYRRSCSSNFFQNFKKVETWPGLTMTNSPTPLPAQLRTKNQHPSTGAVTDQSRPSRTRDLSSERPSRDVACIRRASWIAARRASDRHGAGSHDRPRWPRRRALRPYT